MRRWPPCVPLLVWLRKKGPPRMERMAPRPWRVALGSVVASVPDAKIRINGRTVPVTNSALRRRQMAMNPRERPARARVVCPTRNSAPIFFFLLLQLFCKQKTKNKSAADDFNDQRHSTTTVESWLRLLADFFPLQMAESSELHVQLQNLISLDVNLQHTENFKSLMTGETSVKKNPMVSTQSAAFSSASTKIFPLLMFLFAECCAAQSAGSSLSPPH